MCEYFDCINNCFEGLLLFFDLLMSNHTWEAQAGQC